MDLDNKNIFEINQSYHFPFIDGDISKNGHFYCVNNQNIPQEENLEINNIENILQNPENNNDSFSSLNDSRIYFNTNNIKINEPDKEERKIINPDNEISKYKKDLISIKKENKQTSKEGLFITKMPNKSKKKENNISNENLLNKKTKEDREKIHDKYSGDNLRNKCITLVLRHLRNFINEKIKEKYENIGNGKNVEKLLINPSQNVDKKIASYKEFINRTLKEIFSEKISSKYKKYKENHNKSLIDILMNEKNNENKDYFQKLFSLTFFECVKHFVSENKIDENYKEELDGLTLFRELKNDPKKLKVKENDNNITDYFDTLEYYLKNFDSILNKTSL